VLINLYLFDSMKNIIFSFFYDACIMYIRMKLDFSHKNYIFTLHFHITNVKRQQNVILKYFLC